jgi:hypothetical protein
MIEAKFNHDSNNRWGAWWIVRYHLGSLAFGSFIVAVVWSIRIVFEFVDVSYEVIDYLILYLILVKQSKPS